MNKKTQKNIILSLLLCLFLLFSLSTVTFAETYELEQVVVDLEVEEGIIQPVVMDLAFFTQLRTAGLLVFDENENPLIPNHIKSSDGNYYALSSFTQARTASDGTNPGALALLNQHPELIVQLSPYTVEYVGGEFIFTPPSIESYTLTVAIEGQGTTNPTVGAYEYEDGTSVVLTAYAAEGWDFDKWVVGTEEFSGIQTRQPQPTLKKSLFKNIH